MRTQDWLWIWHCLKHKFGISAQGVWGCEYEGECRTAGPLCAEDMVPYLSGIVEGVKEGFPVTVDQLSQHCDLCQCVPVVLEVGVVAVLWMIICLGDLFACCHCRLTRTKWNGTLLLSSLISGSWLTGLFFHHATSCKGRSIEMIENDNQSH